MRSSVVAAASIVVVVVAAATGYDGARRLEAARAPAVRANRAAVAAPIHAPSSTARRSAISPESLTSVIKATCTGCHSDGLMFGGMSLDSFKVASAAKQPELVEKMITKLRTGMMPPPGEPRPGGDTLTVLVETLEQIVDKAAAANPNPGVR